MEQPTVTIRSAGRTMKGRVSTRNQDYICCSDFAQNDHMRGLYAVADGSLSTKDGDRASEAAVLSLKDSFQDFLQKHNGQPVEETNLLGEMIPKANRSVLAARNGAEPADRFVASMVCGYLDEGRFYFSHAGNGAIFLVHDGKIQRLTENVRIESADDPALSDEFGSECLLGLNGDSCKSRLSSVGVYPGDTILLCSAGLLEVIDNITLLEMTLAADKPEEGIDAVFTKAMARGGAGDLGFVVVSLEPTELLKPRYVHRISYPASMVATKYTLIILLAGALCAIFHFGGQYLAPQGVKPATLNSTAPAADADSAVVKIGEEKPGAQVILLVETVPEGAAVDMDGIRQAGVTPLKLRVSEREKVEITVSMDGYMTHTETITVPAGIGTVNKRMELSLSPGASGALKVVCRDSCDYIRVDGKPVDAVKFPLTEISKRLPAGTHKVEAGRKDKKLVRQAVVGADAGETVVMFDFTAEPGQQPPAKSVADNTSTNANAPQQKPAPAQQPRTQSTPQKPAPAVIRRAPQVIVGSTYSDDGSAPAAQPETENRQAPPATDNANAGPSIVVISTASSSGQVSGCRIRYYQSGRLVKDGYSGEAVSLKPGNYDFEVSKEGYKTYSSRSYFGPGSHTIPILLNQ